MGLTGSTAALREVAFFVSALDSRAVRELRGRLSLETEHLIEECFINHRDPWGRPWPRTWRGGSMLRDTGRLFNARTVTAVGERVRVDFPVKYAGIHNRGGTVSARNVPLLRFRVGGARGNGRGRGARWVAKKAVVIPRRQFVPEGDLPPEWVTAYVEVAAEYLLELAP